MGCIKLALKMLKINYQKTFFYGFSLVCSSAVIFLFFNFLDNKYLGNSIGGGINFASSLSLALILISSATACFANNFYLSKKNEELGIYTLSGAGIGGISLYLIIQNYIIILITMPIGLLISLIANPILNYIIYSSYNITGNLLYISLDGIAFSFVSLIVQTAALTLVNAGYAYRHDILQLIQAEKTMIAPKPASSMRMPIIVYWISAFAPFLLFSKININTDPPLTYLVTTCLGLYGVSGLFRRGLPKLFKKIQLKINLNRPIHLVALGHLSHMIMRLSMLIMIVLVAITSMLCICLTYHIDPTNGTLTKFSYAIIIILVSVCIVNCIMGENLNNGPLHATLFKLGYTKKELVKIIKTETIGLYSLILGILSSYIVSILYFFVINNRITLLVAIGFVVAYFIPITTIGVITYFNYKKVVLAYIEGGN